MFYKNIVGVLMLALLVLSAPNVGRASTQYDFNNIAQIEEIIRLLESLRAYLAKLQGSETESSPIAKTASITGATNGENPIISGQANGYSTVGFSIGNGDKVYGSGDIAVVNGYWSHKVATDLEDGKYQVDLYVDTSRLVDSFDFVVGELSDEDSTSEGSVPGPKKNHFSCNRDSDLNIDDGELACYGLWDFGGEFGDDENMCQNSSYQKAITGCKISAPVCDSGKAVASRVISTYKPWYSSANGGSPATDSQVATIAKNLKTSKDAVRSQLIQVWEYKCTDGDEEDEEDEKDEHSIWSYPNTAADIVVVGVYEGGYADGVGHSFRNHPQGEVEVDVQAITADTILILNAYEPVHWKITGVNAQYVKGVLMTGYYDQKISGLDSDVPVIEQTYANGAESDEYFIVYNGQDEEDDEFSELVDYVEGKTGLSPYLFFGGYAEDRIVVSLKG